MSQRNIIFTSSPFAKSDIQLGSLIPSRSAPDTDVYVPIPPSPSSISCNEDSSFTDSFHSKSSNSFTATLSKLFSASLTNDPSIKVEIVAAPDSDGLKSFIYKLKNPRELFTRMCNMEEVQEWLEQGYRMGEKAWLVVEYRTLVNACVVLSDTKSSGVSGKAAVPVAELVGVPVLPGDVADVRVEGKFERFSEKKTSFLAKEERVFAVACRRVRLHRWSKGVPTLDKEVVWKSALTRKETKGQVEETMMVAALEDEDEDDGEGSDVEQMASLGDEIFLKLV